MNRKIILPIVIVAALAGILIILNFALPNISIPGLQTDTTQNNQVNQNEIIIKEVTLTPEGFSPISITVKAGETVRFINNSGELASINSNPHSAHNLYKFLNIGELPDGNAAQVEVDTPGTYSYHNHLNPEQQGTIVVE